MKKHLSPMCQVDKTADELAYLRYLNGEYTYQDYADVCEIEGCEPLPMD